MVEALTGYQKNKSFESLAAVLVNIFQEKRLHYLLKGKFFVHHLSNKTFNEMQHFANFTGMKRVFLLVHKERFDVYIQNYVS